MTKYAVRFTLALIMGCLFIMSASAQDETNTLPLFSVTINGNDLYASGAVTSDGYMQVLMTDSEKQPTELNIEVSEGGPAFSLKALSMSPENFGQALFYNSETITKVVVGASVQPLPKQVFTGMIAPKTWLGIKFISNSGSQATSSDRGSNTSCVNLRSGPAKSYPAVDCVPLGTKFAVIATVGEWSQVQWGNQVVYVFNTYVTNTTILNAAAQYTYWDGYDMDAQGCQTNNPSSCEAFSALVKAGTSENAVRLCVASGGVSNPSFGNKGVTIPGDYDTARTALLNSKNAGATFFNCGG